METLVNSDVRKIREQKPIEYLDRVTGLIILEYPCTQNMLDKNAQMSNPNYVYGTKNVDSVNSFLDYREAFAKYTRIKSRQYVQSKLDDRQITKLGKNGLRDVVIWSTAGIMKTISIGTFLTAWHYQLPIVELYGKVKEHYGDKLTKSESFDRIIARHLLQKISL